MLIVKLTPLEIEARGTAGTTVGVVQVTPKRVLAELVGVIVISLLVPAAVVEITHVPVLAALSQEKAPSGDAPQATREGFAAEPVPEQLVALIQAAVVTEGPL